MRDTTHLEMLREAHAELNQVGEQLIWHDRKNHYTALSLLFVVREVVLETLEMFPEDMATQQIYKDCRWRDIAYFSSMVYDLLVHKQSKCALDIASRYQSIVAILLVQFDPKKEKIAINPRDLTQDSLDPPDVPEPTEKFMREEIKNVIVDLFLIETKLKQWPLTQLSERREFGIELVRMREMISQFFSEVEAGVSEDDNEYEIIEDFGCALENDKEWMASIIVALVDDGECENVWKFIQRLKDFAQKIDAFLETKNYTSLGWPYILFPVSDEWEEENDQESGFFDVTLN